MVARDGPPAIRSRSARILTMFVASAPRPQPGRRNTTTRTYGEHDALDPTSHANMVFAQTTGTMLISSTPGQLSQTPSCPDIRGCLTTLQLNRSGMPQTWSLIFDRWGGNGRWRAIQATSRGAKVSPWRGLPTTAARG